MGLWGMIISQTSQSQGKLWLFGILATGAAFWLGDAFTSSMMKEERALPNPQQTAHRHPDDQRTASGRAARLSAIIKDISEGRGDAHWNAAMRGTILPHPAEENKTKGVDNELLARLRERAAESRK